MCETCGCSITPGNRHLVAEGGKLSRVSGTTSSVSVLQGLMSENDQVAAHNREHFDRHGVLAINLMSSPGSGKTSLLEASIDALRDRFRIAVIEGDLETDNDAARIRDHGVPAVQVTTGSACHLDAHMVHDAVHGLDLPNLDIVFIENVGNLVCPASFDLGHHLNVTLLSVTEGDDKPAKYPVMFRAADVMLLTKTDLLGVLDDFAPRRAEDYLRQLASDAPVLEVSTRRVGGIDAWLEWLGVQLEAHRQGKVFRPAIQPDGAAVHQQAR